MVGPNYHRPRRPTPPAFKEADGWTPAQPSDAADRNDWWTVFGDPMLNDLEAQGRGLQPDPRRRRGRLPPGPRPGRRGPARRSFPPSRSSVGHRLPLGRRQTGSHDQRRHATGGSGGSDPYRSISPIGGDLGAGHLGRGAPHHRERQGQRPGQRRHGRQRPPVGPDRARRRLHHPAPARRGEAHPATPP